jgi:hypothetical protein
MSYPLLLPSHADSQASGALASLWPMEARPIVNDRTDFPLLAVVLVVMAAISAILLRWAKRHGWW